MFCAVSPCSKANPAVKLAIIRAPCNRSGLPIAFVTAVNVFLKAPFCVDFRASKGRMTFAFWGGGSADDELAAGAEASSAAGSAWSRPRNSSADHTSSALEIQPYFKETYTATSNLLW